MDEKNDREILPHTAFVATVDAEQLGEQLAQRLLAQGAGELLKALY